MYFYISQTHTHIYLSIYICAYIYIYCQQTPPCQQRNYILFKVYFHSSFYVAVMLTDAYWKGEISLLSNQKWRKALSETMYKSNPDRIWLLDMKQSYTLYLIKLRKKAVTFELPRKDYFSKKKKQNKKNTHVMQQMGFLNTFLACFLPPPQQYRHWYNTDLCPSFPLFWIRTSC